MIRISSAVLVALCSVTCAPAAADGAAEAALTEADAVVAEARAKQALWSEAARALSDARAACARADPDTCLRRSRDAIELAKLGILQSEGGTGPR